MNDSTDTAPLDDEAADDAPLTLSLDGWHRARGGRMVPFAGYVMPVQYEGIIAEHLWTRAHAGLFDVSHMGQLVISGPGAAAALETLLPADLAALKPGNMRYSLLLATDGGILDDLMITNISQGNEQAFYVVVNGATKWEDLAYLREHLPDAVTINHLAEQALLALQGPAAAQVLDRVFPGVADGLRFMQATGFDWQGVMIGIGRSGYTGEDGFEINLPATHAERLAELLTAQPQVHPIGLGARDSLRLEAGLPLYGHDITGATDPISAGLGFAISKRRRAPTENGGGGFAGADRIARLVADGAPTARVGLVLDGRLAAREGATVVAGGAAVGTITSGGFSPTLGHPIAMAYVARDHAAPGTDLQIDVRGRLLPARVVAMPFVPHQYHR